MPFECTECRAEIQTAAEIIAHTCPPVIVKCTGLSAVWCPRCGDCNGCDRESMQFNDDCDLHGCASEHAEDPRMTE